MERNKNDLLVKILFAVELALLPMVFFANLLMPKWTICIFVLGIFCAKLWFELMKDKNNKIHMMINAVASVAIFTTLLIFFMINFAGDISKPIAIIVICLVWAYNAYKVFLFDRPMPEFIEAVDFCYVLFELLLLVALTLVMLYSMIISVMLFALMLASIVAVGYKTFYLFKYTKLSGIFKRKK